jgi:hypothetical protein
MSAIYTYIDWFIYLNLVFSQLDIVLIEFAGELIITYIVTRMYISTVVPVNTNDAITNIPMVGL